MSYNEAADCASKQLAQNTLGRYIEKGKMNGMRLLQTVQSTIIRPLNVFTSDMRFEMGEKGLPDYYVNVGGEEIKLRIHTHAFSRMRQEVDLSSNTVRCMIEGPQWDRKNLEMLLNSKFSNKGFTQRGGGAPRFINLVVQDEVRGFVGRGFKRHLRSGPLLDAFIKGCAVYGAMPVDAIASDLRVTLQCMLPYIFSPRDNEYLALGMSLSNSDFGAGSFKMDLTVMSLRNGAVMPLKTLNGNGRGESHNGGSGDEGAVDSTELSEDTIHKLIRAKQGEVIDSVGASLSPGKVNAFLDEVAVAMDRKISWYQFERYLRGKLNQEETAEVQAMLRKDGRSSDLPDVDYDFDDKAVMDLWFASNVVAQIATKADGAKKEELQGIAGKLLVG